MSDAWEIDFILFMKCSSDSVMLILILYECMIGKKLSGPRI